MAVKFTISSGPFNVPIVQHVVITTGDSYTQARWYWEYVRSILFSHFPHFESTRSYIEDYKHDRESNTYHDNVLIFIDLEPAVLKEICEKHGGEYLTPKADLKLWICRACPVEKACAVFAEKCPDRCVAEEGYSDEELQELQDEGHRAPVDWTEGDIGKLSDFNIGCLHAERCLGMRR